MTIGIDECPNCHYKGDMNIDAESYGDDALTMHAEAGCDECGATWLTSYKFTGISDLEINEAEDDIEPGSISIDGKSIGNAEDFRAPNVLKKLIDQWGNRDGV